MRSSDAALEDSRGPGLLDATVPSFGTLLSQDDKPEPLRVHVALWLGVVNGLVFWPGMIWWLVRSNALLAQDNEPEPLRIHIALWLGIASGLLFLPTVVWWLVG